MKIIYIAGPFRAPSVYAPGHQDMFAVQENIMFAMKFGLAVARIPGMFPLIPHSNCMFFTGSAPDMVWLEGDLELMKRCDGVLMLPTWGRSTGARAEHDYALKNGIPIFYNIKALREDKWL